MRSWIAPALLAAMSAGCGHTPLTSMMALSAIDIQETDIERFRVAVDIPEGYRLPEGGVRMTLAGEEAGERIVDETFSLVHSDAPQDAAALADMRRPGRGIHVFRVSPAHIPRFEAARAVLRRLNRGDRSLSIDTDACSEGQTTPDSLLVTTYVQSAETGRFIPLLVDVDLVAEAKPDQVALPRCEG